MTPHDKPAVVEARARELLACPFCGAEGELVERHNPMSKWRHSVDCDSTTCGASGPVEATKAEAIAAWNTRKATDPGAVPADGDVADLEGSTMPKGYADAREVIERAHSSVAFIECWTESEDDKKRIQSILAGLEVADMLAALAHQQPALPAGGDGDDVCATCGHRRREHGGEGAA